MSNISQASGSPDASPRDIYLQPHSDDICFSLGAFAHRRRCGILLTVFARSAYLPFRPGAARPPAEWVTKTRIAEDKVFAEACGLSTDHLDLPDAALMGQRSTNLGWVNEDLQRIKAPLLHALLAAPLEQTLHSRPWLFCPSGIGGHVDHVAVRMLVQQNYDQLSQRYRIGFYEDLYYASSAPARNVGIINLFHGMPGAKLHRHVFPLGEFMSKKIALIQLYGSQFLTVPQTIEQFTPALEPPDAPHEAIWCDEPIGPRLQTENHLQAEPN